MNQKTLNIVIIFVLVVLIGTVVYVVARKKSEPTNNRPAITNNGNSNTNPSNTNTTANPEVNWKDTVYNQLKDLANWKVEENLSNWRLLDLDRSQLNKFGGGNIFYISKSFNETEFPGPNIDQQIQKARQQQTALENEVRKTLTDSGWKFTTGPTEDGFYHDYLYVKNDHPLILQIGTRDAVIGGMYISVEFQY